MIKQWMEFCDCLQRDPKDTAEAIADSLARDRAILSQVFYDLATTVPRKSDYTVFVRMDGGTTYIATFSAYNIADAKILALKAANEANASTIYTVIGVADGDITLLEWNDET